MSVYQCCDCGEVKASKSDLEAHLNSDHIGWSPYQCFYCCQQGVRTRKPNKEMLRDHITQRHPNHPFTFLCTDDQTNKERLKDMIRRSTSHIQSTDATDDTFLSATGTSPDEIRSPFVITLLPSPQPKVEIVDIEESTTHSTISTSDSLVKIEKQTDIKPNLRVGLGNCRCEICQESVPRNLIIIRDHVKVHFKEKTGCVPADLTHLLPSLQYIYYQLLMTSFPSVGALILNDVTPNCNQTTNQEETEDIDTIQEKDNGQENPENDIVLAGNDSVSSNTVGHHCEKCGTNFRRLTSLNAHLERWCKLNVAKEDSKSTTTPVSPIPITGASHLVDCDVCGQKFLSMNSMHVHRFIKHGITVQWHCKQCNLDFQKSSGCHTHLLHFHLHKRLYECGICGIEVQPSTICLHHKRVHGGLGKALVVNNLHRYKDQVELLRKRLIIDRNSSLSSNSNNSWKLGTSKKLPLRNIPSLKRKNKPSTKKRSPAKLGKRYIFYFYRYRKEIEELRNTLIIDINAMGKILKKITPSHLKERVSSSRFPKFSLNKKNHVFSESVEWMSRFKRSEKRKRKQREVLPFKRFSDIHEAIE